MIIFKRFAPIWVSFVNYHRQLWFVFKHQSPLHKKFNQYQFQNCSHSMSVHLRGLPYIWSFVSNWLTSFHIWHNVWTVFHRMHCTYQSLEKVVPSLISWIESDILCASQISSGAPNIAHSIFIKCQIFCTIINIKTEKLESIAKPYSYRFLG